MSETEEHTGYESRLSRVEAQVSDIRVLISKLESDMRSNTSLLTEIRDNTSEVISLIKAGKALGEFAKWVTMIGGGMAAGWALLKLTIRGVM